MQRNPGYPSIEGELEKAICKAGGISAANAESFSKVMPLHIACMQLAVQCMHCLFVCAGWLTVRLVLEPWPEGDTCVQQLPVAISIQSMHTPVVAQSVMLGLTARDPHKGVA